MKYTLRQLLLSIIITLTANVKVSAQEVFFSDPNKELRTIAPDYYYPMKYGNDERKDFINDAGYRYLSFDDNQTYTRETPDRWYNTGNGIMLDAHILPPQAYGGLLIPGSLKNDILNNKTLNMSFWIKPGGDVTDPVQRRRGIVFYVGRPGNVTPKIEVVIEDLKIKVYVLRNGIPRPIISTDFEVNYGTSRVGDQNNGYFFFAITSTWNEQEGSRCRIYVGRPGGRLYCKYFYCSPFAGGLFDSSDELFLGKPSIRTGNLMPSASRPQGISDAMFYTSGYTATYMMNPDDVLNNFYLQSPLYEGVSYKIGGNRGGVWGLESRRNSGVALDDEYITIQPVTPNTSITPFGFDRFYVHYVNPNGTRIAFSNMANGMSFNRSSGGYIYTQYEAPHGGEWVDYFRITSNPGVNYQVGQNFPQFNIKTYSRDVYYDYYISGDAYLNGEMPTRGGWYLLSANKVFRGPQQSIHGLVQLRVHGHDAPKFGTPVAYDYSSSWSYVGLTRPQDLFLMEPGNNSSAYPNFTMKAFTRPDADRRYLSGYYGPSDVKDHSWLIIETYPNSFWELLYVKDDANNKPLYMMRSNNKNVGFKATVAFGNQEGSQVFLNGLDLNGSVNDRRLWSVCNASMPRLFLGREYSSQLSRDSLASQDGLKRKPSYNGLSKTDWPDEGMKP